MSFGFSTSDILAVGKLAWTLYHDCYKVARGAPQEFQLLLNEISTLTNSFKMLEGDITDPNSALRQAGDDRVRTLNEMVRGIEDTLKKLEKVAKKYDILGSSSKRRQLWAKLKWSIDFSDIDNLRNKLVYHNTVMNLLLTSVGNSSLQRIISSNAALQNDVKEIKSYIARNTSLIAQTSSLFGVKDEVFKASLSAALMKNAEALGPWSTIGINEWIETGRWWLIRSQMELFTLSKPKEKVPKAAYVNLIKSSWILMDIITCHPQVPFVTASTQLEVQSLSAETKNEFARLSDLGLVIPNLDEIETQDLSIWEVSTKAPDLRPRKSVGSSREWTVASGEHVLFQRSAICELRSNVKPLPCIVLFLVQKNAEAVRLVAQHQDGSIMMTVTFEQPVSHDAHGKCVTANDVKLYISAIQDVQILDCMLEATNNYLHKRRSTASHADLDNLKALILLTAVKNLCDDAVERLLPLMISKEDFPGQAPQGGLPFVALSLASLHIKGEPSQQLMDIDDHGISGRRLLPLLYWAIECGYSTLVEIMAKEVSLERSRDVETFLSRMTPLGLASYYGHENIVRILLANGVDPNERDANKDGALHHASIMGHKRILVLLLQSGADINMADKTGRTLLHYAAENDIRAQIAYGANVMARTPESYRGDTPLHTATQAGNFGVTKVLLENGADSNDETWNGNTPLHEAREGHEDAIKVLLDHGAVVDTKDLRLGSTAIMKAIEMGHLGAVLLLIAKGANPLIHDNYGYDVRHHCFMKSFKPYSKLDELVATVYKKACEIMRVSSPCPPITLLRRAEIILCVDVRWVQLWLLSHHAFMILPPDAPPNVIERYKRVLVVGKEPSSDYTYPPSTLTLKFSVIHQEDTLEFAVESFGDDNDSVVSLQVVGGGKRSCSDRNYLFERVLDNWPGVELDPDAEVVDPVELGHIDIPGVSLNTQVIS